MGFSPIFRQKNKITHGMSFGRHREWQLEVCYELSVYWKSPYKQPHQNCFKEGALDSSPTQS
jgi:hypothetical protein